MRWRRRGFDRPCANASTCARYDPAGTVGAATLEIRGILSAFNRDFGVMLDDDEQHRLKHEALNRITVLEGTLALVRQDLALCTCGAVSPAVADLLDRLTPEEP